MARKGHLNATARSYSANFTAMSNTQIKEPRRIVELEATK